MFFPAYHTYLPIVVVPTFARILAGSMRHRTLFAKGEGAQEQEPWIRWEDLHQLVMRYLDTF